MTVDLGARLPSIAHAIPGPRSRALVDVLARTECPSLTTRRKRREEVSGAPHDPIVWARAKGSNVVDADGNVLVDLEASFGAVALGHAHDAVVKAITEQSEALVTGFGDVHPSDVKIELCERLAAIAPWPDARVMLGSHGADAVEAALKTAMLATRKAGIVAFEGGYHGLSHGPLAACGYSVAFRAPFAAQLNPHVRFAKYPRSEGELDAALDSLDAALAPGDAGCVLVEPILGRGGVVIPPRGFLPAVAERTRRAGALLVIDEVLTGLYRTGTRFRFEAEGVVPDVLAIGKALGGGLPMSACLAPHEVMRHWGTPDKEAIHTATHFGHPLACAAALAALDRLDSALGARATEEGAHLVASLRTLAAKHAAITDVRGAGLLVGLELDRGARTLALVSQLLARGFVTLPAGADARVLSLTPALTIDRALLDAFVAALDAVLGVREAS
jgi:4-aminobutyrate aminotransferase/(S)-3-amino-2-methylpropionate transaminase